MKDPQSDIVRQMIELRLKRGLTQAQLAERVGTAQPSIARLESRGRATDLAFIRRVADALDARLEVRFVPREADEKRARKERALQDSQVGL